MSLDTATVSLREKVGALFEVVTYRPKTAVGIVCLSVFSAVMEGFGLSFLVPIVEIAQGTAGTGGVSGIGRVFVTVYETLGIPFVLETVVAGVVLVMTVRYASSFLVSWLQTALRTEYVRHLQTLGFEHALGAEVAYYDEHGSDEILNAILTQAGYAGGTITESVQICKEGFLATVYISIALYLAPWLTLLTGVVLGAALYGVRRGVEPGYDVGDRVAEANERVQTVVQSGTQGIREVKSFNIEGQLFEEFRGAVGQSTEAGIRLGRNEALLNNLYNLIIAVVVFVLVYLALRFTSLSLASLGVFLFAMFRLAPRASALSDNIYQLEGDLPHLIRTQRFVTELKRRAEQDEGTMSPPPQIDQFAFENVSFGYGDERVLDELSFEIARGEFVAFVGPSGAGKSTVSSLLARLYDPDSGRITASGTPIDRFPLAAWRDRVSIVRQDPHVFNDTLRYNVSLGDQNVGEREIHTACETARVTEFLDELPDGLDTSLGDDGVRLSGGQRQRVALARALLKDADLLILDEATSDLDSNIEAAVHRAIERMDRDFAMLVIAHRLSTVINADRIYTLVDGAITEQGPHDDLVGQDGVYATLYETQTRTMAEANADASGGGTR